MKKGSRCGPAQDGKRRTLGRERVVQANGITAFTESRHTLGRPDRQTKR